METFGETLKTKHGIDRTLLMLKIINILEDPFRKARSNVNKVKSFIVQQTKRGLTKEEENNFYKAMAKFMNSDGGTNDRIEITKYLSEAKFLND